MSVLNAGAPLELNGMLRRAVHPVKALVNILYQQDGQTEQNGPNFKEEFSDHVFGQVAKGRLDEYSELVPLCA